MESEDVYNGAWATSLVIGKSHHINKNEVMRQLAEMGLPTRPFFYPLSSLPAYSGYKTGNRKLNPITYDVSERGITLPASFGLSEAQVLSYSNAIRKILRYETYKK
jgi:perosamine synthetase